MIFIGKNYFDKQYKAEALALFEEAHEMFSQALAAKKLAPQSDQKLDTVISIEEHEVWGAVSLALTQQTHASWFLENKKNSTTIIDDISGLNLNPEKTSTVFILEP